LFDAAKDISENVRTRSFIGAEWRTLLQLTRGYLGDAVFSNAMGRFTPISRKTGMGARRGSIKRLEQTYGPMETTLRDYTWIYINGAWIELLVETARDVINPATEKLAAQIIPAIAAWGDRAAISVYAASNTFSLSRRQARLDLVSSILGIYAKRQHDLAGAVHLEPRRSRHLSARRPDRRRH
jgi:hypothetical protein